MGEVALVETEFEPVQRAAVLMLALGEADAARILRHLEPREVQRLGAAMSELEHIQAPQIQAVMDVFLETVGDQSGLAIGANNYMQKMMVSALGEERASVILERIVGGNTSGLDKLKWMDPRAIADFVLQEHPQIQAIVLSYLDPEQAAAVLDFFPDSETRSEVLVRVANLESISPSALAELSVVLEEQVSKASNRRFAQLGGRRSAAEILNNVDSKKNMELLETIQGLDEALGAEIQELMFVFDNLMGVDDRGIQAILRDVSTDILVLALKGAELPLQEKIFANMSKRAAELLADDMEAKGPVRLSEVEGAQKEVLQVARRLADSGEIVLGGAGGEAML